MVGELHRPSSFLPSLLPGWVMIFEPFLPETAAWASSLPTGDIWSRAEPPGSPSGAKCGFVPEAAAPAPLVGWVLLSPCFPAGQSQVGWVCRATLSDQLGFGTRGAVLGLGEELVRAGRSYRAPGDAGCDSQREQLWHWPSIPGNVRVVFSSGSLLADPSAGGDAITHR